ncbi:hypothetical protein [Streptomyces sp. NPDC000229]|uniref:hypothetical protein n=1 Tax=Streptomyces sp. NPDC000229 TaxID=3154247 RepID=UPI00332A2D03
MTEQPPCPAAVRESYDTVADDYVRLVKPPAERDPVECGPGRVTAPGGTCCWAGTPVPGDTCCTGVRPPRLVRVPLLPLGRLPGLLEQAGPVVSARLEQEPVAPAKRPHACLPARKPAP